MANLPLVKLWDKRSLIINSALMNIKIRYKGTYLGLIWTVLEPLLMFILLYVVFTTIRVGRDENFGVYLLSGILLYHIFIQGTMLGMNSLVNNKNIIQSLNIRREFFPVVTTTSITITTLIEAVAFFSLLPAFQFIPAFTAILFPLVGILLLGLILGVSYLLSILNVYFRDIQRTWPIVAHALFFVSPIFWYLDEVQAGVLLNIHAINPIGQIIELGHNLVIFGNFPPLEDWLYATFLVLIVLSVGYAIFQKLEKKIIEEL